MSKELYARNGIILGTVSLSPDDTDILVVSPDGKIRYRNISEVTGTSGTRGTSGTMGTSGTTGTSGTAGTSGTGFTSISNASNNRVLTSDGTTNAAVAETNLTFDGTTLNVVGNLFVNGTFSVSGSSSVINTNSLVVSDSIIALGHSQSGTPLLDEGIMFVRGTGATQAFIWDESADEFALISTNDDHTVIGNINISGYSNLKVGTISTTNDIQLNNAGYIYTKTNTGDKTRSFGLNVSNNLYIGSVDKPITGILFNNNGSDQMYILANGNVGIGTMSATSKLTISGSDGDQILSNISDDTKYNRIQFKKPTQQWSVGGIDTNDFAIADETLGGYRLTIKKTSGHFILNSGRTGSVSIGTDSLSARLNVRAASSSLTQEEIARFDVADDTSSYLRVVNGTSVNGDFLPSIEGKNSASNTSLYLSGNAGSDSGNMPVTSFDSRFGSAPVVGRPLFQWNNYNVPVMTMNARGWLGIGTASPGAKLHIFATESSTGFRLVDGTQGPGKYLVSDVNGAASWTASSPSGTSGTMGTSGTSGTRGTSGTSGSQGNKGGFLYICGGGISIPPIGRFTIQAGGDEPYALNINATTNDGASILNYLLTLENSYITIQSNINGVDKIDNIQLGAVTNNTTYVSFVASFNNGGYSNFNINDVAVISIIRKDGTSGTRGTSGTSGTTGAQGIAGVSGTTGTSGTRGTSGTSGTTGAQGIAGVSGTTGTSGTSGTTGAQGIAGVSGTTGTSGTRGTSGTSGTTGEQGIAGVSGTTGTSGTSGTRGTSGTQGRSSGVQYNFITDPSNTNPAVGNLKFISSGTIGSVNPVLISVIDNDGINQTNWLSTLTNGHLILRSNSNIGTNFAVMFVTSTTLVTASPNNYYSLAVQIANTTGNWNLNSTDLISVNFSKTGPNGTAGTSGTTGTSGTNGTHGTSGTRGTSGTAGTSGTSISLTGNNFQVLTSNGAGGITSNSLMTFDGGALRILPQFGDEGGEIILNKPVTNTSIDTGVTIDVYKNSLRFYETGGAHRGVFFDLTTTADQSNLIHGLFDSTGKNISINTSTYSMVGGELRNTFLGFNSGKLIQRTESFIAWPITYDYPSDNTFIGSEAGNNSVTLFNNVFIGSKSGYNSNYLNLTTGYTSRHYSDNNVFIGSESGYCNQASSDNVFIGHRSGYNSNYVSFTVYGGSPFFEETTFTYKSEYNTFIGSESGFNNKIGSLNSFFGYKSGYSGTQSYSNVFIGNSSGYSNRSNNNTFIGKESGYGNINGNNNTFIGYRSGFVSAGDYSGVVSLGACSEAKANCQFVLGSTTNQILVSTTASQTTAGYLNILLNGNNYFIPLLLPNFNYTLTHSCPGLWEFPQVGTIVVSGISGGLSPYKVADQLFTTQVDAQNNTNWIDPNTSNSHSYSFFTDNITYWISIKDKTGNILVKSIYISEWCLAGGWS